MTPTYRCITLYGQNADTDSLQAAVKFAVKRTPYASTAVTLARDDRSWYVYASQDTLDQDLADARRCHWIAIVLLEGA